MQFDTAHSAIRSCGNYNQVLLEAVTLEIVVVEVDVGLGGVTSSFDLGDSPTQLC